MHILGIALEYLKKNFSLRFYCVLLMVYKICITFNIRKTMRKYLWIGKFLGDFLLIYSINSDFWLTIVDTV